MRVECKSVKLIILITPLCKVIAVCPSGEILSPKGSCVIWIVCPAGLTYLPLGKTDLFSGFIEAYSL